MTQHARPPLLPETLTWMAGPVPGSPSRGTVAFMPEVTANCFYARPLLPAASKAAACVGTRLDRELLSRLDRLTVQELGRRFAADLQGTDLPRPFHLVGFSFAGFVAFEAARHLVALGDAPANLWLLDTNALRKLPGHRLLNRPLAEVLYARRFLRHKLGDLVLRRRPDVLHRYGYVRLHLWQYSKAQQSIIRGLYRALLAYRPEPWPEGRAILVRAADEWSQADEPDDLGWRRLVPSCEVIPVPGGHLSMLQVPANVAQVASALSSRLDVDSRSLPC